MAIEIVDFPIKMVIFHGYVAVYQNLSYYILIWWTSIY